MPCGEFTPAADVLRRSCSWEVTALHKVSALLCDS